MKGGIALRSHAIKVNPSKANVLIGHVILALLSKGNIMRGLVFKGSNLVILDNVPIETSRVPRSRLGTTEADKKAVDLMR